MRARTVTILLFLVAALYALLESLIGEALADLLRPYGWGKIITAVLQYGLPLIFSGLIVIVAFWFGRRAGRADLWGSIDPTDKVIILEARLDTGALKKNNPALVLAITFFNGHPSTIVPISASGTFRVDGERFPTSPTIEETNSRHAKYGDVRIFGVRQWIREEDREAFGEHPKIGLNELKVTMQATDFRSRKTAEFDLPLPEQLTLEPRNKADMAWFYSQRFNAWGDE